MAEYEKKVREILKKNSCIFIRHGKDTHELNYNYALLNIIVDI